MMNLEVITKDVLEIVIGQINQENFVYPPLQFYKPPPPPKLQLIVMKT
jgi:hypothetical protein